MTDKYILDSLSNPIPEPDLRKWGEWMETADRIVKQDSCPNGMWVSTVFLGLDHSFMGGVPLLFETMVFDHSEPERDAEGKRNLKSWRDLYCERYSTLKEAQEGHLRVVARAIAGEFDAERKACWDEDMGGVEG